MKYLKLYEEYNKEEKLYHRVYSGDPFVMDDDYKQESLTQRDKDKLDLFIKVNKLNWRRGRGRGRRRPSAISIYLDHDGWCYIYKVPDEYFYLLLRNHWFKCDTIDGVIGCIEERDEKSIEVNEEYTNEFYQKVTQTEYSKVFYAMALNDVKMTNYELERLWNLNCFESINFENGWYFINVVSGVKARNDNGKIDLVDYITVCKDIHDFFLCHITFKNKFSNYVELYFKCDQISSLIEVFEDYLINVKEIYENLNEPIKLYTEIDDIKYVSSIGQIVKKTKPFNSQELDKIKPYNYIELDGSIQINIPKSILKISKIEDEWFFAKLMFIKIRTHKDFPKFYKCDSIDGVIELVDDLRGSISESKLYKEFGEIDDDSETGKFINFEQFNQYEKDKLIKYGNCIYTTMTNSEYDDIPGSKCSIEISKIGRKYPERLHIYKHRDEWFSIYYNSTWYSCDSIDGVIEFIQELKNDNIHK